jgi:hypothetical protein
MRVLVLRILAFLVGALLVPPPGWCCMLLVRASPDQPKSVPGKSCCKHEQSPNTQTPPRPEPCKSPRSPGDCPCTGRIATPLVSAMTFADCLAPAVSTALLVDGPAPAAPFDQVAPLSVASSRALHLRCCVWRC